MNPQRLRPGPGQESVWDYPRPPRVERSRSPVRVEFGGVIVAESHRAMRVLETSQPPAFYVPPDHVRTELLVPSRTRTFCEWKGEATYFSIRVGEREAVDAAWTYTEPFEGFEAIAHHIAFYAQRVDACFVDGEQVAANPGEFYGGWITSRVVGPFKGGPGTATW